MQAKLRQQSVNRPDLNAIAAACIPQLRSLDMIAAIGNEQRQRREPLDDLCAVARAEKSLEKFLNDKTGCMESIAGLDGPHQFVHLRCRRGWVSSQRQRPNAGVDKKAHPRERSAL